MNPWEAFKEALFPSHVACLACGREAVLEENGLCAECSMGLERFISALPLKGIDGFTAVYIYNDVSSAMVKRLKYAGAKYIAAPLGKAIELPEHWHIDAVVPVPLHKRRIAERGFNQSELIAKAMCRGYGLKMDTGLLIRTADTPHQTRMSGAARKRSLKNAFRASDACAGLDILLVDDVRTTGTTLCECAAALKKAGCNSVYAAAVCFAVPLNKEGYYE